MTTPVPRGDPPLFQRPIAGLLLSCLPLAALPAQNNYNEVMRFGARDLVQSVTNQQTLYALEVPGAQPPGYMTTPATGVAAGTLTWIWYPSQLNSRHEARQITGHMVSIRPSSSTPFIAYTKTQPGQAGPGVPIYIPKFSIYPAKKRGSAPGMFGAGYDPDFSKAPLLTYNTVHTPLVQPAQADMSLLWTVTYNTKIKVDQAEVILAFEWQGGEHFDKPLTQSLPTGWSESMFSPSHWGWAGPGKGRKITYFDPAKILPPSSTKVYSSPMGGYFEHQATIGMHSSWGENREPSLKNAGYPSYNVGSGIADLGGRPGTVGWDVFTSSAHQGKRAMPLFNFQLAPHPTGTSLLGNVLEVDLGSSLLTLMWGHPLVDGVISNRGVWLPPKRLFVPRLGPTAIGLWLGMEYAVVDLATGGIPETTQATWFFIVK